MEWSGGGGIDLGTTSDSMWVSVALGGLKGNGGGDELTISDMFPHMGR